MRRVSLFIICCLLLFNVLLVYLLNEALEHGDNTLLEYNNDNNNKVDKLPMDKENPFLLYEAGLKGGEQLCSKPVKVLFTTCIAATWGSFQMRAHQIYPVVCTSLFI